jgi:hypothetical protein
MHTVSSWALDELQVERYIDSEFTNPVLSGAITGSLFMSARGPRAMALAGVLGAGASTVYHFSETITTRLFGRSGRF